MPVPPSAAQSDPADQPVLFLTLSSSTMPLSRVNQYAETVLAQRLSMVSGVAGVNVFGAQKFAVRIDIDPTQLASRQIGIDEVAQAIASANVNRPTGTLFGPERNFVVETSGQLMDADGYRPIPVAYRNGSPVPMPSMIRPGAISSIALTVIASTTGCRVSGFSAPIATLISGTCAAIAAA